MNSHTILLELKYAIGTHKESYIIVNNAGQRALMKAR